MQDLFADYEIITVRETTLGGNQWIEELTRLKWQTESNDIDDESNLREILKIEDGVINVLLKPMEIRTFIITQRKYLTSS